jgi:phosphatidylglycerol---prolipoprotein diacylglyceryl transferase
MTGLLFWLNVRLEKKLLKIDRTEKFKRKIAFDLALIIMISGFLGGRLLHVVYEEWLYYMIYPLEVFKFWKGGYVYYGGWFASFFCAWLFLRHGKLVFLPWLDFFTPLLSLGYALGRVACYFEGCCYGNTFIPLQLIMVFCELALLGAILFFERRNAFSKAGLLFLTWVIVHASTRFFIEFYRADDRGSMIFGFLSVSQVISILLVSLATLFVVKLNRDKLQTSLF